MVELKFTTEQIKELHKLKKEGYTAEELAKKYHVSRTTIFRRLKQPYGTRFIPLETKNAVIKKIKEGYGKAEVAHMFGLSVFTVEYFTKGLPGYRYSGYYFIRKHGIELLRRLLQDGCLITGYNVPTVRGLQKHFPMIRTARFKDKTFFYLEGREEDTIEAYFRDKPDKIINYSAIEELSYLLGVKITKDNQRSLVEKYKGKHVTYWKSRWLIQRKLEDFLPEAELALSQKEVKPMYVLLPTKDIIDG
jgi:hypothetical protein